MRILITALLSDYKLKSKLIGLSNCGKINEIILIRKKPLLGIKKIKNIYPKHVILRSFILFEIWRLISLITYIQLTIHGGLYAFIKYYLIYSHSNR